MVETLTLTLSGTSSILETNYFPPIELSSTKKYALGLVELLTFNSIPNIDVGRNKFYVGDQIITIPTGSYELENIEKFLKGILPSDIELSLQANNNTLHSEIKCNKEINFLPEDSIGKLLGFNPQILETNTSHESELLVNILAVNAIRVECNITTGAYINNQSVHTIHEFFPVVPPGYKITELPTHIIYHPLTVQTIHHLQLRIIDQNGKLVNFRGEVITVRLHIKRV